MTSPRSSNAFERAKAAVAYYRSLPRYQDREAAEVAADACEEAGLHDDARWYRISAGHDLDEPTTLGVFFGWATNLWPETMPRIGGERGEER